MATTFLPSPLAGAGRIEISAAWGADVQSDSATWTWDDITDDVLVSDGAQVQLTHGKADEAGTTQPATATLLLDNRAGDYSLGSQGAHAPYVRRGTPIRVRVSLNGGSGWTTRFFGYADTWQPSWDQSGRMATVTLSASGTLRRLGQGVAPLDSTMRRAMLARTDVVAYWPAEEKEGAQSISSGIAGFPPMSVAGNGESPYPEFGKNTNFPCSAPLSTQNKTVWRGPVPTYTATGQIQVRLLVTIPKALGADSAETTLFSVITTGSANRWDVVYVNIGAGSLKVYVNTPSGRSQVGYNDWAANDTSRWMGLSLTQSGSNVNWKLEAIGMGYAGAGNALGTLNSRTIGRCSAVTIGTNGDMDEPTVGHVTVHNAVTAMNDDLAAFNANDFELVTDRLTRLCGYQSIPLTIVGSSRQRMGPQSVATLLDLLRECEAAEGGLLLDGYGAGLTYVTGPARDNLSAALTLDAAQGETSPQPVDDDQGIRNRVRAERTRGGSDTVEATTGILSTTAVGVYDDTITANVAYPDDISDLAGRAVARGQVVGYRYPTMPVKVHRDPGLAAATLALLPGQRVDVTGFSTVRTQNPAGTIPLMVEGYSETLDRFTWDVQLNCSSQLPWRSANWAATSGDSSALVLRADTDGSTLNGSRSAGATSLSVATPSGPLWTTVADDLPMTLDINGQKVTVTAVSGASSPQTMTCTALTAAIPSGAPVQLWDPLWLSPWRGTDPGGRLTAGDTASAPALRDLLPRVTVLAGDITVTSSQDLIDVPGLSVDVDAHSQYLVEGCIFYTSATGPPGAEARFALAGPSDGVGTWATLTVVDGSGSATGSLAAFRRVGFNYGNTAQTVAGAVGAGTSTAIACPVVGTLQSKGFSGAVCLRFAQLYSDATLTTVNAGSWLRLTKVKDYKA